MNPYYSEKGIEIYNADCREVLPELGIYDLCLTDPPYGIGTWSATGGNSLSQSEAEEINKWDKMPEAELLKLIKRSSINMIVWGGNHFMNVLGSCRTPLIWDKGIRGMHFADGEMAWTNFDFGALRIFSFNVATGDTKGNRLHPTQKPLNLMKWCINFLPKCKTILDPFMGSGTTLEAAKDLGRSAVGIELEEKYCEIAAKRLKQKVLEF
jgi:site-specific DNA-methyltransferase (adenine-specific)